MKYRGKDLSYIFNIVVKSVLLKWGESMQHYFISPQIAEVKQVRFTVTLTDNKTYFSIDLFSKISNIICYSENNLI